MYRKYFDLSQSPIYLNNGTHTITPKKVMTAITDYQNHYNANPTLGLYEAPKKLEITLDALASYFKSNKNQFFLRPNVTEILNLIILGIQLESGDEILMGSAEYGAIKNIGKLRAEKELIKYREFEWPDGLDSDSKILDCIEKNISSKTKILVLSHILFGTGEVLPINKIGALCRLKKIIFVVDGAHALGSIPISFADLDNVDFYGGNFHKWMMGPKGTAIGWFHKNITNNPVLKSTFAGWTTYDPVPGRFDIFDSNPQKELTLSSCYDFAPFYAIKDTLDFWNELGAENIFKRIHEMGSYLKSKMKLVDSTFKPLYNDSYCGPLFCYRLPKSIERRPFEWMFELLNKHQIQITVAPYKDTQCLRVSPHIYNTQEDIDKLIEALKQHQ